MASLSGPHRSRALGVHRRDLDEDQHDPPARLGAERPAPRRQGSSWPLEDRDVSHDRIDAPCLFDGPINGERFRAYVEQFLTPTLKPGDVVILDNLGSHKGKAVRQAIRAVGARLVFLPKYSPDLNPIEQVFAKFKTLLRKAEARTYDAIADASAAILAQYPPEECAAYVRNAGYA
jgi:transposase